jgi:hypothetical protein
LSESVGFEAGIERFLNFGATGEVGFCLFSGLIGSDEALVDIRGLRGFELCPLGFVDVFIQADFKFVVGLVQVETEGMGAGFQFSWSIDPAGVVVMKDFTNYVE